MAPISLFCGSNGLNWLPGVRFEFPLILIGKLTMINPGAYSNPGTKGGGEERGFRRCFSDGLNQSLVSSTAQAIGRSGSTFWTLPKHGKKQFSPLLLSISHSCRIAVLLSNWSQRHQTVNELSQSNFHWADDSLSFALIFTLIGQASDGMQSFTWDNFLVNGQFDY